MRTKWKHSKVLLKGGSNWEMTTNSSPDLDVRWSFKLNVRPCKENIRPWLIDRMPRSDGGVRHSK